MVKAKLVQVFLAHDGDVNDIVNGGVHGNVEADLIFVIFLHKCTLGSFFLHMKARKLWQNFLFFSSNFPKISPHVQKFSISPTIVIHGKLKFLHMVIFLHEYNS